MHEELLGQTLTTQEFGQRFADLHRQLWASNEFKFDDVTTHVYAPPAGMYQVDHSIIHDGENWHVYYATGDLRLAEPWNICRAKGDCEGASAVCVEPGNGHAVGRTLFDLRFVENVFFPSQGRFDLMSRGVCSLFKHDGNYGMLYDVRGSLGERMSLAWSDDLSNWRLEEANPVLSAPNWANPNGAFKDPHVMAWNGIHLIYAVAWEKTGQLCICLITTEDWRTFHDQGPVFRVAPALRGTFGIESPQVVYRRGLWHLFFTHGPGLWHAIGSGPKGFFPGADSAATRVAQGAYLIGPFHATEMVQDGEDWWMTTDRKEETRRLNREVGRMCYRGTYEDERTLEEGIYLSRVQWNGDRPLLQKPTVSP
jgi:hypothetical protein